MKYTRSLFPGLPFGLWTLQDKTKRIEQLLPQEGAAVITGESYAGHVAYLEKIEGDHLIIREANYKPGYVTLRRIHKSKALGYISMNPNLQSTKFIIAVLLILCVTGLLAFGKLQATEFMVVISSIISFYFGMNVAEKGKVDMFHGSAENKNPPPPNIHGEVGDGVDEVMY